MVSYNPATCDIKTSFSPKLKFDKKTCVENDSEFYEDEIIVSRYFFKCELRNCKVYYENEFRSQVGADFNEPIESYDLSERKECNSAVKNASKGYKVKDFIDEINTLESDCFSDVSSIDQNSKSSQEIPTNDSQESCYFSGELVSINDSEVSFEESHYFKQDQNTMRHCSSSPRNIVPCNTIGNSVNKDANTKLRKQNDETDDDKELKTSTNNFDEEFLTVEPFFNITPRDMPQSPHRIIEEEFKNNPWVMLVATIFLTKTTGRAARPFMKQFFTRFPTPLEVLDSSPTELERYFTTLGMKKRGCMIWKMSYEFISAKWRRASDLHGIGKYGEDAYRLFCLGHTDIEPTDRYLRLYLEWLQNHTNHELEWSKSDCESKIYNHLTDNYCISLR